MEPEPFDRTDPSTWQEDLLRFEPKEVTNINGDKGLVIKETDTEYLVSVYDPTNERAYRLEYWNKEWQAS